MYDILFEDIDADEIAEERIQGVGLAEHDRSRELARANQCERCLHLHQSNTCTDLFMIAQSICVSSSSRRQTLQHGHTSRIQHSQQHIEHHIVFHAMLGACGDCAGTVQGLCRDCVSISQAQQIVKKLILHCLISHFLPSSN